MHANEPLFAWNAVASKRSELSPADSTVARKFKRSCDEIATAYLGGKLKLEEILNETMSEALLVYVSEHMPPAMRSALRAPDTMQDLFRLALGISLDRTKLISPETQHLAIGLFVLVHTKGSVVQCNTTFQPGHAVRCSNLWHFIFDAMVDCKTKQTKYFIDADGGFDRVASAFSTIIRHCVMDWHKGTCVLTHLGNHPEHVDFYIDHLYNDDLMIALIRLIFCDHTMASMQALKSMRLMRKLLPKLLSDNASDALLKQNLSVVLRSLIRAPYVTGRGDLIFAKSIPVDKLTGQPDYVLLCGTSRDLDSSPMRQFTSRKIRHLVHVLIENNKLVPQLLEHSFSEWSSPTHSDFACSSLLSALLDLVTTVEFSERTGKGHIGIECSYFPCQTHQILSVSLMYGDEPVTFLLNCMMGLMITPTHNQGPISIAMSQLQSVTKTHDGFTITMSEPGREAMHFTTPNPIVQAQCIEGLNNALEGNLVELDIFCSEDWKSNVAEYQQLRLALVQSLEAILPKVVKNTVETWSEDQPGLSWKLTHICDVFQAMVGMESKRLDGLLVSSGAISAMLQWFKFNHSNVVCSRITQMLLFYITDPNGKRSRTCPVITQLMKELPTLLLDCVLQPPHRDVFSYLQCIYDAVEACIQSPHSNSHLRIAQLADEDETWHKLAFHYQAHCLEKSASGRFKFESIISEAHMPLQPAFHKDILDLLAQPTFASYDIGSAFLVGNGCVFGYVYKQDPTPPEPVHISVPWRRTLIVFEQSSFKLWCFVPSQHKANEPINWQWIVPTAVRTHYCQGEDEHHTSIGHHGFDVISDAQHNDTVWHLCTTALHERDEWLKVFQSATATISALASHYATKSPTKPKKKITNCVMCNAAFHVFKRPYPCHRCGQGICSKCSKYFKPIPEMGVYTPVRHCEACFKSSGGAMSESCPIQIMGGVPLIQEDHGHVTDVDRIGGFLQDKAAKAQRTLAKPKTITIPNDHDVAEPDLAFPTTPMQVEDVMGIPTTPLQVEDITVEPIIQSKADNTSVKAATISKKEVSDTFIGSFVANGITFSAHFRICSQAHKRSAKMIKKLVLHFDLNRTIVMSDVAGGRSMENTLNYLLSECTYGRVEDNKWICVSKEPSLTPPAPSLITYKKFVDELYPYDTMASGEMDQVKQFNKSQKKQRTALQSAFTSGPGSPVLPSYQRVLDNLHFPEGPLRNAAIDAAKSLDASGLKEAWSAGRYYLLPSFLHFLHYMSTIENVQLSVVFRTFGEDITEVAKELEFLCDGKHPLFLGQTLPDSMRLKPPYATFYRDGFDANGTALALNTLQKVPFHANVTPESFYKADVEITRGFAAIQETIENNLIKDRRVSALRDYWEWWSAHAEHAEYGKLLLVTPSEGPSTIFFDDHIEETDAHIVDVRDTTSGEPIPFALAKDIYLKRVEPFYAITDQQYYIKQVANILSKL